MAYLLVCLEDDLKVKGYGMALVWVSPHQAQASMVEEALGTLSTCFSSGPNWPYVLAWLYKGSNHTPLPKDKHLGILPRRKVEESPYGQISQLTVCQLLSPGLQVIYPVGWNGSNQLVLINLLEPLYSRALASLQVNTPIYELTFFTYSQGARVHNSASRWSTCYSSRHYTQNSLEAQGHPDNRG